MTKLKVCIDCGATKPVSQFCKDAGYKDGYRGDCNKCRNGARRFISDLESESIDIPAHGMPDVRKSAPRRVPSWVQDSDYKIGTPVRLLDTRVELPNPEHLPAAYLKRCADYWTDLLGENTVSRIA